MTVSERNPADFLQQFGLRSFRPAQLDVIQTVLAGEDCLCIMPTGGGKSLCYQLPAIMQDGLTLVVSPLIALMKDQVDALCQKGIRATLINSTLTLAEQNERLQQLQEGAFDLVYVAPERFRSQRFLEIVRASSLKLLAVDEAHCISEWGHDFRHDYARLGLYRKRIGRPPTIALTATATPDVQQDILQQLEMGSAKTFVAGFGRENLSYRVLHHGSLAEKTESVQKLLRQFSGSGIIYVSTRKTCEQLAETLAETTGFKVGAYHAGLEKDQRRGVQEAFMSSKIDVVVATNAFGMGIDKSDVRFVIHYNMPGTLEAYYQEAGRAGRDGLPSVCVLLYAAADQRIQKYFIENAYPEPGVVEQVYEYLRQLPMDPIELTQHELRERLRLEISQEGVGTCERLLEKAGGMRRLEPHRNMAVVCLRSDLPTLVDLVSPQARNARRVCRVVESKVGDMRHEPVYVQLQSLAEETDLTIAAVRKALADLAKLDAFDYVPPFRGRAIHITNRQTSFESLNIDFRSMDERKQLDYDKLKWMVRFAHTQRCRQLAILDYFGQQDGQPCRNCDVCNQTNRSQDEVIDLQQDAVVKTVARIAISGVARAQHRVGKNAVAAMLCGSQSVKMRKLRFDKLSTFGRLKQLKQTEVATVLEALLRVGWLEQFENEPHRPLLRLTTTGREVMLDTGTVNDAVVLPKRLARKIRSEFEPAGGPLSTRPVTPTTPSRAAAAVPDHSPPPLSPSLSPSRPSVAPGPQIEHASPAFSPVAHRSQSEPAELDSEDYLWTWKLVDCGLFSAEEILVIRRIDRLTFCEHLIRSLDAGKQVSASSIFDADQLQHLSQLTSGPSTHQSHRWLNSDIRQELRVELENQEVLLFLKCHAGR